jgi:phospholipid/cholesterol/gamma-HCH transport system permease protein
MIEKTGRVILDFLEETGNIIILLFNALRDLFSRKVRRKTIIEQLIRVGNESIPIAVVTACFTGMVFSIQVAGEFIKYGAGRIVGAVVVIAVVRELAPVLTGVIMAGRIGAAFAAEIGTMKVTEQIDALYSMGSSPSRYLVGPRLVSCLLMLPVLTIFADVVGFLGGYLVSVYLTGVSSPMFLDSAQSFLKMTDILGGLTKAFVFGGTIAVISCYKGLKAEGGAKGVGLTTTSSVVTSLMTIFVINYFLSVAFFK